MKKRVGAVLVLAGFLAACGGGSGDNNPDVFEAKAPTDTHETTGPLVIDTQLSTPTVAAGEFVTVTCSGNGFDPALAKFVVLKSQKAPEGSVSEGVGAENMIPDVVDVPSLTYPPTQTLPEGTIISGMKVKFTKAGDYAIACYADDAQIIDPTPADLTVNPAAIVSLETTVDPKAIKAGEWVNATCVATDVFGNPVDAEMVLVITRTDSAPAEGVTASGLTAQLTKATTWAIACSVKDSGPTDLTPEIVTVSPNVPKKVITTVEPATIGACNASSGPCSPSATPPTAATVSCTAADFYDNPVDNFPVSVFLPPKIYLTGKTLTSTTTNIYPVKCVPQNIEWKYFTIVPVDVTVTPGQPVSMNLKVVPKKSFYSVGEMIEVTATAVDAWDNLVPDAALGAPTIDPPTGIEPSPSAPTKDFTLKATGDYLMTFRLTANPAVHAEYALRVVSSNGPIINILYPPRGATLKGKPSVTVLGKIEDDKPIQSLTINGQQPTKLSPDGSFQYLMIPSLSDPDAGLHQGLNVIHVEVQDSAGLKANTTRGYYFSLVYYDTMNPANFELGMVLDSARAFLGPTFFDDGVHDPAHPNDLATLVETVVASLNLNSMIPSPVASAGPYKVYISGLAFDKPALKIDLLDDAVHIVIDIPNLRMNVGLVGKCSFLGIDFCPDFSGSIKVAKVTAELQEALWFDETDKKIHAKLQQIHVALDNPQISIDGILGWLLNWLVDIVVNSFKSTIETMIEQQIGGMLDGLLTGLFDKFTINQTFAIPELIAGMGQSNITLAARPSALEVKGTGVTVALDAKLFALKKVVHDVLGSIARSGCLDMKAKPLTFDLPHTSQIEFAGADDLINEALFAVWFGGTLNLTIGPEMLKGVDLSAYGVSDLSIVLDMYLPPILSDCNKAGNIQAQIGDLHANVNLKFNDNPMRIDAFLQAAASVSIDLAEDAGVKKVGISLLGLDRLDLDVISIEMDLGDGFTPLEQDAKDGFVQLINDQLLSKLPDMIPKGPLASFAIPAIDLASLMAGLPAGTDITFSLDQLYRKLGYTAVGGHPE